MATTTLTAYLNENHVPFEVVHHRTDYTAQETAADTHTPGREFAKTVVLDIGDQGRAMAVLPAVFQVDMEKLRAGLGTRQVHLADEAEMSDLCPDCEVGAEPPFGNLYDVPVYVDPSLTVDEYITFNAGSHDDALRMRYEDYERLVHPTVMDIASLDM
jgi:Ala-tRNA(Pro) deacylase